MATCKTVTVSGPSKDAPTISSFDVTPSTNTAEVSVTWRNPNSFTLTFDSVLSVDGNTQSETVSIGSGSTKTVTYTVSFDIPAGGSRSKEFCVDPNNVST